ncbi:MAG: respiratory nitrate reductase subunit gamma [Planctomycetes bacterium]|nr:respiratory nitrate reductase subunit gamma [Planctomycetota bacterium]
MPTIHYVILVPMVYVALVVFLAGTAWRGVRIFRGLRASLAGTVGPTRPPRRIGALYETLLLPKVLRHHPVRWALAATFHLALLLLVLSHLELVTEIGALQVVPHDVPLGSGVVGAIFVVAVLFFLCRRFHAPARAISAASDYYLLIVLLLTALFGLELHLARSLFGYATVEVDAYREYLSSLLTLRPTLPEALTLDFVGHPFLLALHVFFANLFLLLFPWSKMMHALLAFALTRLGRR